MFELGSLIDTTLAVYLHGGEWNWITYPCYTIADAHDALVNVIDDLDYIMAQEWSMKKEDGNWIYSDCNRRPILRYGDSIMVRSRENRTFYWNSDLDPPEDEKPIMTMIYVYDDKPDYETIMINSIDGDPVYDEIGVFQSDECVGASVYDNYPIQILAYTDPDNTDPLEFRIVTSDKQVVELQPRLVHSNGDLYPDNLMMASVYGFRHIDLSPKG